MGDVFEEAVQSNKSVSDLESIALLNDFDGLVSKLNERQPLSSYSKLIYVLATKLKEHDEKLKEHAQKIKEQSEAIDVFDVGREALNLGTFPLVLSYDCMKILESDMKATYKKHIKDLSHYDLKMFGSIVKQFQCLLSEFFIHKVTGDDHKVCLKIGIGTYGAALYNFVKRPEFFSYGPNLFYTRESMQNVTIPFIQAYRKIMKEYISTLPELPLTLIDLSKYELSLKEWSRYFELRLMRDHKGGHCASWRDGLPNEAQRLHMVKTVFCKMIQLKMPEVSGYPILRQLVSPCMERYIKKKEAQSSKVKINIFEDVDYDSDLFEFAT